MKWQNDRLNVVNSVSLYSAQVGLNIADSLKWLALNSSKGYLAYSRHLYSTLTLTCSAISSFHVLNTPI